MNYSLKEIKHAYAYYQELITGTGEKPILGEIKFEDLKFLGRRNLSLFLEKMLEYDELYFKSHQEKRGDEEVKEYSFNWKYDFDLPLNVSSDILISHIISILANASQAPLLTEFRESTYLKKGDNVIFFDKESAKWIRGTVVESKHFFTIKISGISDNQIVEANINDMDYQVFSPEEFSELSSLVKSEKGLRTIQTLLRNHEAIAPYHDEIGYLKTLLDPKTYSNF